MSGICKVNYPLYCCHCLDEDSFVIAGGGGAAKTGVRNCVQILELKKEKRKCMATPIDQLDTGKYAVMSMAVSITNKDKKSPTSVQEQCMLALSMGNNCHVYSVIKSDASDKKTSNHPGLTKRKKGSQSEENPKSRQTQGISSYKFKLLHEFSTVPGKGFQTSVQISQDGKLIAAGASDGRLRAWKLPSKEKIFDSQGHSEDITDVDISPDNKQIVTASRDGKAYLWDASSGHKTLELHTSWNMYMVSRNYRFRNCRFSIIPEHPSRHLLFTSHSPMKQDMTKQMCCCLTKWARKKDKDGNERGPLLPAIVQNTGKEAISSIATSRNGIFLGVGFMEGSVAIYIAFSLQCAQRVSGVHNIFVTSLSFLNDTEHTRAITGDCDAALISVSADCTCQLTKLESRTLFSLWLVLFICIIAIAGSAFYLHSVDII